MERICSGDNTGLSDILDTQDVEMDFLLAYLRFTGFDFFARFFFQQRAGYFVC
jgi:hypothetical protein